MRKKNANIPNENNENKNNSEENDNENITEEDVQDYHQEDVEDIRRKVATIRFGVKSQPNPWKLKKTLPPLKLITSKFQGRKPNGENR